MRICRSCLKVITSPECYSLNQSYPNSECLLLKDKCKVCISELDLDLTTDAVLCGPCYDTFNLFYNLRLRCLEMQEKIRNVVREKHFVDLGALAQQNQTEVGHVVSLQENLMEPVKIEPEENVNINTDGAEATEKVSGGLAESRKVVGSEEFFETETALLEVSSGGDGIPAPGGSIQDTNSNPQSSSKIEALTQSGSSAEFVDSKFNGRMRREFKCSQCDYKTCKRINLEKHRRLHKYSKPFACKECGYTALENWLLQSHMAVHAASKLHKCKECDYRTAYRSNLMIHIRKHMGEESYRCTICNKSYMQNSSLIRHMKEHSKTELYKCLQCDYHTFDKNHFCNHLKLHTEKLSYACHICDKKFACKFTLARHVDYHTMYHSERAGNDEKVETSELKDSSQPD